MSSTLRFSINDSVDELRKCQGKRKKVLQIPKLKKTVSLGNKVKVLLAYYEMQLSSEGSAGGKSEGEACKKTILHVDGLHQRDRTGLEEVCLITL